MIVMITKVIIIVSCNSILDPVMYFDNNQSAVHKQDLLSV